MSNGQQTLGFMHQTAATSVAAVKAAAPKRRRREIAVENHLLVAGPTGLTRYELAASMDDALVQTICGIIRPMIVAGLAVEDGRTRPSPNGRSSKVIIHPQYAKRGQ